MSSYYVIIGVVRGAGRRGSVACEVAQRALLLCAFMFVCMSFMYFRLYFRCILAFFVFVCAAVYGVIKNNKNNNYAFSFHLLIKENQTINSTCAAPFRQIFGEWNTIKNDKTCAE